jgi:trehalose/maltose hydrolase-like predicted phosphorylase
MNESAQWSITDARKPTRELAEHFGNKFLLGNGLVGVRGCLDEYTRAEKTACIPTGIYDQQPRKWREPVNLPNPLFVQISVDGRALHAVDSETERHVQRLDFRRAVASRETVFLPDAADPRLSVTVSSERFASMQHPNLLCAKVSVTASKNVEIEVLAGVDGEVWDINGPHLSAYRIELSDDACALFSSTREKQIPIVSVSFLVVDGASSAETSDTRVLKKCIVRLEAGRPIDLFVFGYVGHGDDAPKTLAEVRSTVAAPLAQGYAALLAQHERLWRDLWAASDVTIVGDAEAQHALRYSLYHLLAIAPYHTKGTSIPARGLSGQVYKGAVFWDTELFMFPFFLHTNPRIARTLLEYRISGLPGAKEKAREYGYAGAFYAWESQEGGRDACTHFNVTNVFTGRPIRTFFRDKQIHISGDIPLALRQYCAATGDLSILAEGGAEVIYECARFLHSWSYINPTTSRYELLDVTGPDEYHERVNNDCYTNVLAAHALETALWTYDVLEAESPAEHRRILERTGFAGLLPSIREMAAKLHVPQPDPTTGIIPQFDRYFALEDVPISELESRRKHPTEYLGGGEGLAVCTQVIKQADVVLTLSTFADRYCSQVKRDNWNYYEPRTEHGSTLSACSYAIVAAEIGEMDFAYEYFMKTATIDIAGTAKQYVGDLFIGGTHPAANGGAWLSVVRGFCGVVHTADGVAISPRLPARWEKVIVPYRIGKNSYEILMERGAVSVKVIEEREAHPRFTVNGNPVLPVS